MNLAITLSYPAWLVLLCLLLGAAYATALYFREKTFADQGEGVKRFRWVMAILRFVGASAIAMLLLAPFIKTRKTDTIKPIIVFAQDESESIGNMMSTEDSLAYVQQRNDMLAELEKDYEVVSYSFGGELSDGFNSGTDRKATNISGALGNIYDLYFNQNVGAVILASDGIYNQGSNPSFANLSAPYPVFTVAMGDTSRQVDLRIAKVNHNKIAYLDDRTGIRVDWEMENIATSSEITLYEIVGDNSKKLTDGQRVEVTEAQGVSIGSVDFTLNMSSPGVKHYRAVIGSHPEEQSTLNNSKDFFIEVLDSRQKILMVAAAPHPDLGAIKSALESNKNYELEIQYIGELNANLEEYNLVILHQLPSQKNEAKSLVESIQNQGVSSWYIIGAQSFIGELNGAQSLVDINKSSAGNNEVTAVISTDFSLFTLSEESRSAIPKFPPLYAPFGQYMVSPNAKVLMSQKIGSVGTDYPLLVFGEVLGARQAVLTAEGIWRWRLHDYMRNKNHKAFNEFVNKTVTYLSVKADKRQFRVNIEKNIFLENEPVTFDAQLYNEAYELVNEPEVEMLITDQDGNEYPYQFSKTSNAYQLNAGFMKVGDYNYTASTSFNGKPYEVSGSFSVSPLQLEALRTRADHQLLYNLSSQNGGAMVFPENVASLAELIQADEEIKPVLRDTYKTSSVINLKWLFPLLLGFIALEWFFRKYNGGY